MVPPWSLGLTQSVAPRSVAISNLAIGIHCDDPAGFCHDCALNNGKANAPEPKDSDGSAGFHFRCIDHCANTGGHAAAQEAYLV